jgi:hypothetical protein
MATRRNHQLVGSIGAAQKVLASQLVEHTMVGSRAVEQVLESQKLAMHVLASTRLIERVMRVPKPVTPHWDLTKLIDHSAVGVKPIDISLKTGPLGAATLLKSIDLGMTKDLWASVRPLEPVIGRSLIQQACLLHDEAHYGFPYFRSVFERVENLRWQAARLGRQFRRPQVLLDRRKLKGGNAWTAAEWQRRGYDVTAMVDDLSAFEEGVLVSSQPVVRPSGSRSEHCRGPGRAREHAQRRPRLLFRSALRRRSGGRHRWTAISSMDCRDGHTSILHSKPSGWGLSKVWASFSGSSLRFS